MPVPGQDEIKNPQLRRTMNEIATVILTQLPPGYGFLLAIFSNTTPDFFYASSAERNGIVKLLREAATKLEALG